MELPNLEALLTEAHRAELHVVPDRTRFVAVVRSNGGDLCRAEARSLEGALSQLEGEAGSALLELTEPHLKAP